jgi:hypothetical protein
MSSPENSSPPLAADPPERVLRRLFLTLFLRGRTSRGLQKEGAPKSVGRKLAFTLVFYALFGLFALMFIRQPVFALSVYLHAMTFVFLGMFVAASAGEILFNKEEADILLHRPVTTRALLWAKVSVLVQVSLWLAGAFNIAGLFVGVSARDGGWLFPAAHAISTTLEALFCTGCIVMTYQLCLRWFGRERLDALMTTAQVLVSVGFIVGSQLMPRLMIGRTGDLMSAAMRSWWLWFLPPAWFAGFDDAIAGGRAGSSWLLAALALIGTAAVIGLAFGRLARDYGTGLQTLSEAVPAGPRRTTRRWLSVLVKLPPLRWWLRDSVSRAAFMLSVAYLLRDRDTKLRVYPSVTPMAVFPILFLFQDRGHFHDSGGFGVAFAGGYLALIPLMGLNLLQYSQQWQAADLFRAAPMPGPLPLCDGARRAVLCVLTLPMLAAFGLLVWLLTPDSSQIMLLLPGIIALPIYALIPCLGGKAVPLSLPTEEAKSAGRGLTMMGVMLFAVALSGLATWAWSAGWFWWLVLVESVVAVGVHVSLYASLRAVRWSSLE